MESFEIGDLVVLTAGSMRMAVEKVEGEEIACVWCHEGRIGRDTFNARLVKKWEHREEERAPRPAPSSAKPYRGDRDSKPYAPRTFDGPREDRPRDEKPRGKPGWDGKPREKKFFRKES